MGQHDVGPKISRRPGDAAAVVVGAAVLGVVSGVAARSTPDAERRVFEALHDVPRAVDFALWAPMQAGSAWAPPVAAIAGHRLTRSWRPTVGCLAAGWGGWWLAKAVKARVRRGRPSAELPDDVVRDTAVTEGLGFVSGHSTVAFACAATLSPSLPPRWRAAGYGLATTVAVSRVVVGAHLPLDVVGGVALGLVLAHGWHLAAGVEGPAPPTSLSGR